MHEILKLNHADEKGHRIKIEILEQPFLVTLRVYILQPLHTWGTVVKRFRSNIASHTKYWSRI